MSKRPRVRLDTRALLAEVEAAPEMTKQGAWSALVEVVDKLRVKGYSWQQVYEWLKTRDLTKASNRMSVRSSYVREKVRQEAWVKEEAKRIAAELDSGEAVAAERTVVPPRQITQEIIDEWKEDAGE